MFMVKGINKRVVVIRFPDTRVFEQAIFIVREEAIASMGVSADQVLREACRVAEGYVQKSAHATRKWRLAAASLYAIGGAAATALVWLLTTLLS